MSFERHHPNRRVDRNLAKARDLRSAYLVGCLATMAEFMARLLRNRPRKILRQRLAVSPMGKQPI